MKKVAVLVMVLVFSFSGLATAVEPKITVGAKVWYSTYKDKQGEFDIKADPALNIGPAIMVSIDKFFIGLSYLINIQNYEDDLDVYVSGDGYQTLKLDLNKKDLDFSIGYKFHENGSFFVGYKRTDYEFEFSYYGEKISDDDGTMDGPVIGMAGNVPLPINPHFVFFGTLAYCFLDDEGEDANGPAIEFGVLYGFDQAPASISLGYKYQNYEFDDDGEVTFSGFTLGCNYTF